MARTGEKWVFNAAGKDLFFRESLNFNSILSMKKKINAYFIGT
jgi:hypothetical protein